MTKGDGERRRAHRKSVKVDPRKRPGDPPPGMEIEFISMAPEDKTTLDRFLHAASRAGAAKK